MRSGSVVAWLAWILLAAVAATGLRQYRVDNQLSEWVPRAAATGPFHSYCVVGFPTALISDATVSAALRSLPSVAWTLDGATVATFGAAGTPRGITPENFVTSPSGDFAGVYCFPRTDISDEQLIADVRQALRRTLGPAEEVVRLGGPAVFHVELNAWSQRRLPAIVAAITGCGALLLAWVTRRPRVAVASTLALLLSQVILIGGLSWFGIPMDMSLSVVMPMMLALGFSYAAHRASRRGIIRTLLLCGTTTAVGIGCFFATDLPPIRRFALCGVIGLALAWTAVVTLVPAPTKVVGRRVRWGRRALVAVLVLVTRHPRWILTAVGVVSVAALPGVFALRFTSNPLDYFPPGAAVVRDFRALNTKLTGMLPFRVSVAGGCDAAARLADTPGVRKVVEVSEFDRSANRVYWCFADNDAVLDLMRAAPEWREWARERGCLVRWTGVAAQIAGVVDTITRVAVLSLPLMVLLAAVVVTLLSKNLLLALLSAWINALPVLCLILLTALARWPLGLPALMIGAIGIGMAIDDTIHVVRGLARGWSVRRTLLYCWQPCAGSTVVVAVCLALFACAPFRPTAQFGVLLSLGSLAALAGDLLALPAAWVVIRRASISRG